MSRFKVVVTRNIGPDALGIIRACNDIDMVLWNHDERPEREWVLRNAQGAHGFLVLMSDKVNDELLDAAGPQLRVVSTMSVGFEHCDLRALAKRDLLLGHTPDVLTDAVADIGVMLALMASRNAGQGHKIVLDGQWPKMVWAPFTLCGPQISTLSGAGRRTVGFVGFGRIAQATLKRLVPFGFQSCLYAGSKRQNQDANRERDVELGSQLGIVIERVDLEEVAKASDVVFLLCPGGEETHHLVSESFLRKMKRTAVLVNVSRGTVVDSNALAKALKEEWIWGAGLDVVEGEPDIGQDHPLVKEPRAVVIPHMGSGTHETRTEMAKLAAMNVVNGIYGRPLLAGVDVKRYVD
ncbi:hypothetical protein EXIGLDRAFT_668618 [Exidia glandulosa HHB12029]|uniref:Glyoxylate reductase n=1 Tax=Exidia glandulosa HHB12029 TaxID=1314781 RepID=A0A166B9Q8_EXIGL|nr:hypothetical protein EXIGLDRAFT_668618 [Exidia glandulosa HHB12029]